MKGITDDSESQGLPFILIVSSNFYPVSTLSQVHKLEYDFIHVSEQLNYHYLHKDFLYIYRHSSHFPILIHL